MYVNIRDGLTSKPNLVPVTEDLANLIKDHTRDWYVSLYHYNDKHKQQVEETGTLSGIRDTITNRLYFDFDSKDNLEQARKDALEVANRLLQNGFEEKHIQTYFTGSKGFSVELILNEYITPEKFKAIVFNIAGDLETFDRVVNDPNRVVRVGNTKHHKSPMYKIPLNPEDFVNQPIDAIKKMAMVPAKFEFQATPADLPEIVKAMQPEKAVSEIQKELTFDISSIDLKERPKGMDEARFLLENGFFRHGDRNSAFLCLAATYKNNHKSESHSKMALRGVALDQSSRTGEDEFPEHEIDMIVEHVYGPHWKNGQFTTRDPNNWLAKYARKMGLSAVDEEQGPQTLDAVGPFFQSYVNNIGQNTITTGIPSLDKVLPITVGNNIGVVAAAGAGKTAFALNVLEHTSQNNVTTVFASLDMTKTRLFEKALYKLTGLSRDDLYSEFKNGNAQKYVDMVKKHYGNVFFYDKSAATISDIRNYVIDVEQKTGQKVKLVLIDYFERVNTDMSDDTAASKKIANEIQDMVNDLSIACISLVQPNKFSLGGGPDTEIKSYTAIKGSSFLYQSFRGIISLSRPFYTPATKDIDKYLILNVLKNDLGELDRLELGWNGKRGDIYELEDDEVMELRELLKMKEASKQGEGSGWS